MAEMMKKANSSTDGILDARCILTVVDVRLLSVARDDFRLMSDAQMVCQMSADIFKSGRVRMKECSEDGNTEYWTSE